MIAAISSRRPTSGVGGKLLLRRCQPRLLAQDRALELLQPRAGLDPELVDQDAPCLPTCLERLVLTSRAVESEDLLLGVRMLATYVENFGSFEQDRTRYWLLADFLCSKRDWSVQDLNEWLTSCPSGPRASADIDHVPIHEIPVQAASCLILAS